MEGKKVYIILGIIAVVVLMGIIFVIFNFSEDDDSSKTNDSSNKISTTTKDKNEDDENQVNTLDNNEVQNNNGTINYLENAEKQMAMPNKGDTIAVIHVKNYGDITVKFFENVAPKAVENFITHAKEGYYDGVIFHRVIDEFMIQGGDPEGTGYGGESIWGKGFEEELDDSILPYRGSLCMASSGVGTSSLGSQFFITQAHYNQMMEAYLSQSDLKGAIDAYKKYGGDLYDLRVYGQYTVFGQVVDGMDIVDKIASVQTDENDKPVEDVVIENIEIKSY